MNKTVIITGGTTGIGKASALLFAQNGYNVVVTSRDATKERGVTEDFKREGVDVIFFQMDVTKEEQVKIVIEKRLRCSADLILLLTTPVFR